MIPDPHCPAVGLSDRPYQGGIPHGCRLEPGHDGPHLCACDVEWTDPPT